MVYIILTEHWNLFVLEFGVNYDSIILKNDICFTIK